MTYLDVHSWMTSGYFLLVLSFILTSLFSGSIMPRQFYNRNSQNVAWRPLVVPGNVQIVYHRFHLAARHNWLPIGWLGQSCSPQFPMFIVTQFVSKSGSLVKNWFIKVTFEKLVQSWISRVFKNGWVGKVHNNAIITLL